LQGLGIIKNDFTTGLNRYQHLLTLERTQQKWLLSFWKWRKSSSFWVKLQEPLQR